MVSKKMTRASLGIALTVLFAASSVCIASPSSSGSTAAEKVEQEAVDAGRAIRTYSVRQRDKAVERARSALEYLDARIDRLEAGAKEHWHRMDQAARDKEHEALKEIRRLRNRAGEEYGRLKYSSSKAWDGAKKGFTVSYDALREAWKKAEREWGSEGR